MPFGPRAAPPATPVTPPSAADFWGERSASIHDALPAPADGEIDAPAHPATRLPAQGRLRVAAAVGLIVAVVSAVAVASGITGPSTREARAPKVNMAAVLSSGVARILERGLARLDVRAGSSHPAMVAQNRVPVTHRTPRGRPVFTRVHEGAPDQATPPISYASSASADLSRAPAVTTIYEPTLRAAGGGTSEASSPTPRPASQAASSHPSRSSPAAVSPTGQSGALGPIQSPNG